MQAQWSKIGDIQTWAFQQDWPTGLTEGEDQFIVDKLKELGVTEWMEGGVDIPNPEGRWKEDGIEVTPWGAPYITQDGDNLWAIRFDSVATTCDTWIWVR